MGDPNTSSTSSCFNGITDAESEEIKCRRNRISVKASNAIAEYHALRSEVPSEDNVTQRGDADQKVEALTRDLSQWQAEALAFAGEFETDALRTKYKKRVMNHIRREKKRMSTMLTLYDPDNEMSHPLEPFMGLMQEQVYGVDTGAPTPCATADSTLADETQPGNGVDPTELSVKLQTIVEEGTDGQGAAAAPGEDEKSHYTRFRAAAKATKDAIASKIVTPKGGGKRALPASAQRQTSSKSARGEDDKRIEGERAGTGDEEGKSEDVVEVDEGGTKETKKGRKMVKPKKSLPAVAEGEETNTEEIKIQPSQEQILANEADEQKKEEIRELKKKLEEAKKRAEALEEKLRNTEEEKRQAREKEDEERRRNEEDERKRREKEEDERKRKEKEEESERVRKEEEKRKRKEEANKRADEEMEELKRKLAEKNSQEKELEEKNVKAEIEKKEQIQRAEAWAKEQQRQSEQRQIERQQQREAVIRQQQHQLQLQRQQHDEQVARSLALASDQPKNDEKTTNDEDRKQQIAQHPVDNLIKGSSRRTATHTSPIPIIGSLSSTPIASNTIEIDSQRRRQNQGKGAQVDAGLPVQNMEEKFERDEIEQRDQKLAQKIEQAGEEGKEREKQFVKEAGVDPEPTEEAKKTEKKRKREEKIARKQKKMSGRWWSSGFDETIDSESEEEVEVPKKVAKVLSGEDIKKIRLARESVREGRPKNESEKLGIDDPKDFIVFRQRFEAVCNIDGLDDEEKLKELGFWTKGAAQKMIASNFDSPDPAKALASAWRQLAIMFKAVVTTPLQRLEPVFKKGQLQSDSITSHFETLADIRVIYNEAHRSGSHKEFDRIDVLRETVDKKLACYRIKFWENQTKEKKEDGNHKTRFLDIIDFIAEKAETASLMGSLVKQPGKTQKTININATETEQQSSQNSQQPSNGQQSQNQPQSQNQQQRPKCVGCGLKNHQTKECHKLMRMDPDKLNEFAKEMFICFRCGETGHAAKSCKQPRPVCKTCGNTHLTIFHAFLIKRNKENLEKEKEKKNFVNPSNQGNQGGGQVHRDGPTSQAQNPIHNNATSAASEGGQAGAGASVGEVQGGSGGQPPEL